MSQKTTPIEISIDGRGFGRIVVDGKDLTNHVAGFILTSRVGEIPRLHVELLGAGGVLGDAQANVTVEQRP